MSKLGKKGFTLIELIVFIVVGAIFLPVSLIAFTSVMNNYSRPDYYVKAKFFADKKMAEITNDTYDNINISQNSCSNPLTFTPEAAPDNGYTTGFCVDYLNTDLTKNSNPTNYTQITVTVKNPVLLSDYVISTIVTRRPQLP